VQRLLDQLSKKANETIRSYGAVILSSLAIFIKKQAKIFLRNKKIVEIERDYEKNKSNLDASDSLRKDKP